ncbi:hypothetical protein SteCoe_7698 [Stentor coeruleus]|uniref:Uncharacterized protein n=1 Tax=Stentor coeruleus TaxID=5963 RepID=A0A1R2CLX2_9CILI|nr:hypothetical protein SteCoe_7698 [Stentor coeruleus]
MNKYSDFERGSQSSKFLPPLHSPNSQTLTSEILDGYLSPLEKQFKVPKISTLTQLENEKAYQTSNYYLYSPSNQRVNSEILNSHTSRDFISLLQSIDRITNGKEINYYKILKEGQILTISLSESMVHYFKIKCFGKRSPLKVNIRRNKGKLKTYVSKSIDKPNQENADYVISLDRFEISENGVKFPYDCLYLSVEAMAESEFSIGISFGKIKNVYIPMEPVVRIKRSISKEFEELRKNEDLRNSLKKKVEKLIKQRKQEYIRLAGSKNFLKLNKNVTVSTTDRLIGCWEEKKSLALQRKYENYLKKKEQAMLTLNKKAIQTQNEIIQKEQLETKARTQKFQKDWIKLMTFIISASTLRKNWLENRSEILISLNHSIAARLIQKCFKNKFTHLNFKSITLLRARNNLLLLNQHQYFFCKKSSNQMLINIIRLSAVNNKLSFSFNVFVGKVLKIQKASKNYMGKTKNRLEEIVKLWNSAIGKFLNRGSTLQLNRYIKITSHIRNEVIKEYYSKKFNEYLRSLIPLKSLQSLRSISQSTVKLPEFKYLPSEAVLKQLIEQAASMVQT